MALNLSEHIVAILFALTMPWLCLRATQWVILRAAEERLRAIPLSLWQPLHHKLLNLAQDILYQLSRGVTGDKLYTALNPERCTQQALKVILPYTEALTDQLIRPLSPVIWDNVPLAARTPIYHRVAIKFKPCVDHLVVNMKTILSEFFDHKTFIATQVAKYETGYRFICTEAVHQYWHGLHRQSRNITLILCLLYFAFTLAWPQLYFAIIYLLIPLFVVCIVSYFRPTLKESTKLSFARCLGYWFGEKIYLVDELILDFTKTTSTQSQLRALVNNAFEPLIEDAPLKTLAQIALGRHALIELRAGLISFIVQNSSTPFEHTQFKLERSLEISQAFEAHLNEKPLQELNEILHPTMNAIRQLMVMIATSSGILFILFYWYTQSV